MSRSAAAELCGADAQIDRFCLVAELFVVALALCGGESAHWQRRLRFQVST